MSLLREIQDAATSERTELPTLLRKCLILAARLNSQELRDWVNAELRGYEKESELPAYRIRQTHVRGTLRAGLEIAKNVPIPIYKLDDDIRTELIKFRLSQSAASLEHMAKEQEISLRVALPAEFVMLLSAHLDDHVHCVNAYRVLPVQDLVEILDTVRTRVLDFVLELETLHPDAAKDDDVLPEIGKQTGPGSHIQQLFFTVVMGDQRGKVTMGDSTEQNISHSTVGAAAQGPSSSANGCAGDEKH